MQHNLTIAGYPVQVEQNNTSHSTAIILRFQHGGVPENVYDAAYHAATQWCNQIAGNKGCTANVNREENDITINASSPDGGGKNAVFEHVSELLASLRKIQIAHSAGAGSGIEGGHKEEVAG